MVKISLTEIALAICAMTNAATAQQMPASGYFSLGVVQTNDNWWRPDFNPFRGIDVAAGGSMDLSDGKSFDVEMRNFNQTDSYDGVYSARGQLASMGYNATHGALGYGLFGGVYTHNSYFGESVDTNLIQGSKISYRLSEQLSINGQIGILSQISGQYPMGRVTFGTVSADYRMSDTLRLAASIGGIGGKIGDSSDHQTANVVTYALQAAYRVSGPVEIYVNVNGYENGDEYWGGYWGNGRSLGLGVNINFGGGSMANGKIADLTAISHMRMTGGWLN